MEDQGIMALPQAGMQAPTAAPTARPETEAAIAAFDQARMQMDPREFGNDLLSAAEQTDPAAVQEFRAALQRLNLPPEIIDALNQMVDLILSSPQDYAQIRQKLLEEGVPEDLLPVEFDPAFFGALNLALDQMSGASMPMGTQQFASGGIVSLKPIAAMLAAQGRNGDTMLAHITPVEARMLRRMGGSGTINPVTGLPEFFLKQIGRALSSVGKTVGNAFKSVGKAISGVVKSVASAVKKFASSTVGRIVTTVALGFFLGPAAASMLGVTSAAGVAAVSGFIGSAGSTLLAGGKVKDALKNGIVGGLTAGAGAGIMSGANAFQAGSYVGPTTVAGQVESFTNSLKSLGGASGAPADVVGQLSYSGQGEVLPGVGSTAGTAGFGAADVGAVPGYQYTPTAPAASMGNVIQPPEFVATAPGAGVQVASAGPVSNVGPVPGTPPAQAPIPEISGIEGFGAAADQVGGAVPSRSLTDITKGAYQDYVRPYTPAGIRETGAIEASRASSAASQQYINNALETTGYSSVREMPVALQSEVIKGSQIAGQAAAKAATPGLFSQYAPIVSVGMGAAYLGGAFDPTQPKPPGIVPRETGFDLYNRNPSEYGVTPGGASTVYAPPSIIPGYGTTTYTGSPSGYGQMGTPFMPPQFRVRDPREYLFGPSPMGGIASVAPRRFNMGGFAKGGISTLSNKFPRRTGKISGPGTETSDSIPAMLSDGEFVMTAKAVRGAGGGSRREGAKRMYQMMRKFERNA